MNNKVLGALLFLSLAGALAHASEAQDEEQYRSAFKELEVQLQELEIDLKQLDLQLSKAIAYGWREDAGEKLAEWRGSLKTAFTKFRDSLNGFFKSLTTRDGERLPEWVYTAAGGALDEVVTYLESRMASEDDHVRAVILEVLRNSVRVYRNKVKTAGRAKEDEIKPVISDEL